MAALNNAYHLILFSLLLLPLFAAAIPGGGKWSLLLSNIGVPAMHMQLLNSDRVVILDRTDFGASNLSLPGNRCRNDPKDLTLKHDCTAHSIEYDIASNSIRPLDVLTNTWCSSGAAMPDGSLMETGGFNDGDHNVRVYQPCSNESCDWQEFSTVLVQRRWYASNHILPDGRQIIVGGRGQFNYEFYPKITGFDKAYNLPFLAQTNDPRIENNLYPFVFLNVDGNVFIFANNRAILFDYVKGVVVRTYPTIPGGDPRNYPRSGSAVLLPLRNLRGGNNITIEVMVCGGAPKGSFTNANNGKFVGALTTCGRLQITNPNPTWAIETMPLARVMGDMVLLPNGNILIINGASSGTAGWNAGRGPVLTPVMYRPGNPTRSRFELQNSTSTPRMYHSTAILLRDGRILVSGSNPHAINNFTDVFPTDLTMQAYSPDYLDPSLAQVRPRIVSPAWHSVIGYGHELNVIFTVSGGINRGFIQVTMVAPPYTTHAFSMNQRMLVLTNEINRGADVTPLGRSSYRVRVVTPGSSILAPPGFYLLFVVYREVPSSGIWVQIK